MTKEIIDLSSAYANINFQYEYEEKINNFIKKFYNRKITNIEINGVSILPDLNQLKNWLLNLSRNMVTNSKVLIESRN